MNISKRTWFTILATVAGGLVTIAVAAAVVAYSGVLDVAATRPPPGLIRWFLTTTRDRSIDARAEKIAVPELGDPAMLQTGARHYREMCVTCHGAPGVEPGDAARGLEPAPPKLPTDTEAAETFWIVKNGIQMTGMPAFGKTHDDAKIWAIVAFEQHLSTMTPDELRKSLGRGGETHSD
jgi:mono/diheme cytochrome c family protein